MTPELLAASAVVMFASTVQGAVGFGLGMLAAPLLALIDPALVPVPLLASALALTLLMAYRERQALAFHEIGWALLGRIPGTFAGAGAMLIASERVVSLLVGIVVFVAVGLIGSGAALPRNRSTLLGAGVMSGFMSTTTSIGGPPVAALYHDARGTELRAAMSGFFAVGLVMSLSALAIVGRVRAEDLHATLWLVPGAILGFTVSSYIIPYLDRGYTQKAVLIISALAGVSVIYRAVSGNG